LVLVGQFLPATTRLDELARLGIAFLFVLGGRLIAETLCAVGRRL
jgi:hypothetical protein